MPRQSLKKRSRAYASLQSMTRAERTANMIGVVVPFLGLLAAIVLLWNQWVDATDLAIARRNFAFRYHSPEHWIEFFRTYYGPTQKAFEALDEERQVAYAHAINELLDRFNRSGDATVVVPGEYLEVVATV